MKAISISVPIALADQVARALKDAGARCPRHKDEGRHIVVIDSCQLALLQILDRVAHGEARIEFSEGRPITIYLQQSFKFNKDDVTKVDWLTEGNGAGGKVLAFDEA